MVDRCRGVPATDVEVGIELGGVGAVDVLVEAARRLDLFVIGGVVAGVVVDGDVGGELGGGGGGVGVVVTIALVMFGWVVMIDSSSAGSMR